MGMTPYKLLCDMLRNLVKVKRGLFLAQLRIKYHLK